MALNYAKGLEASCLVVAQDAGSATGIQIDSTYTFESAGEAWFVRFVAPRAQTSGNLTVYAFCTAVTGTPTLRPELRNGSSGSNPNRPEAAGSTIGSSAGDVTPVANTWDAYTLTGVTLVEGQTYFFIIHNSHGTPASNHATLTYRGGLEGHVPFSLLAIRTCVAGTTANGFTTDPTLASGIGVAVIKFDGSGDIIGYAHHTGSNHPNDSNDRGNRVQFTEDITICGVALLSTNAVAGTSSLLALEITKVSDNSLVKTVTLDAGNEQAGHTMFAPLTLTGGEAYNIVLTISANTTYGQRAYMGEAAASLPADVLACKPSWLLGWVGGATSPGSYTLTEELAMPMFLYIDNNPEIVGGGALLTHPGLGGRLH